MRKRIHELSLKLFTWLSVCLGIEAARVESENYFSQLEARCIRLESILDAMQIGKLKFYADRQPSTQPTRVMDYESSQIAALEEFKEK